MNMKLLKRANRRALGAAAVTTALLVPLGVFGAPALARSADAAAQSQYGPSQYQYKITICHHTHSKKHPMHTIKVSVRAWKAHQKHGDTLGACPATVPAPTSATKHGKSHDTHGNNSGTKGDSGDNGNGSNGHGKGHGK